MSALSLREMRLFAAMCAAGFVSTFVGKAINSDSMMNFGQAAVTLALAGVALMLWARSESLSSLQGRVQQLEQQLAQRQSAPAASGPALSEQQIIALVDTRVAAGTRSLQEQLSQAEKSVFSANLAIAALKKTIAKLTEVSEANRVALFENQQSLDDRLVKLETDLTGDIPQPRSSAAAAAAAAARATVRTPAGPHSRSDGSRRSLAQPAPTGRSDRSVAALPSAACLPAGSRASTGALTQLECLLGSEDFDRDDPFSTNSSQS